MLEATIAYHATVRVSGVSLTNVLPQRWQALTEMALTVLPAVTLTDVGEVALAKGIVNTWETGSDTEQHDVPHGS